MKLIKVVQQGKFEAKIYKDSEWNEFRTKFFVDGKHQENGDHHTDDKEDAINTADHTIRWFVQNEQKEHAGA